MPQTYNHLTFYIKSSGTVLLGSLYSQSKLSAYFAKYKLRKRSEKISTPFTFPSPTYDMERKKLNKSIPPVKKSKLLIRSN